MTQHVLVSPLGFAPGAVSGVYFVLRKKHVEVDQVITVGTAHRYVRNAAATLETLFRRVGNVDYKQCYIDAIDLKGPERDASGPFAARLGLYVDRAHQAQQTVHVAVTGGRSGMGALAALAAQLYRADHLYHLWVNEEIEREGIARATPDPNNRYVNPTVEDGLCELVSLPFADLSGLVDEMRGHRAGPPPEDWPADRLVGKAPATFDTLTHYVPAGLSRANARRLYGLINRWREQVPGAGLDETTLHRQYLIRLHQTLDTRFDQEELRTLCFQLDVDYESLPAEGKANKARELVKYFERRDAIPQLVRAGRRLRPDVPWQQAPEATVEALTTSSTVPGQSPVEIWNDALSILYTAGVLDDDSRDSMRRLTEKSISDDFARRKLERAAKTDDLGPLAWWGVNQDAVLSLTNTGVTVATFVLNLVELWTKVQGII